MASDGWTFESIRDISKEAWTRMNIPEGVVNQIKRKQKDFITETKELEDEAFQ